MGLQYLASPAPAQVPTQKPNILFIMADDIGWMQVQAYDGVGVGDTPNLDRIAKEGARFIDYYAMQRDHTEALPTKLTVTHRVRPDRQVPRWRSPARARRCISAPCT